MFQSAVELLDGIYPLEEEVKHYLLVNIKTYPVARKQLLIKAGRTDRSAYLIHSGTVRVFRYVEESEYTTWIFPAGDFAVSLEGFYSGEPGQDNLEMLKAGEVSEIRGEVIDYLCRYYLSFNQLYRIVVNRSLLSVVRHLLQLQTLSADTVYENFLKDRPELANVPQKYIASFLGVHEKTLTKLRRNYINK